MPAARGTQFPLPARCSVAIGMSAPFVVRRRRRSATPLLPFVRDGLEHGEYTYHVLPSQYPTPSSNCAAPASTWRRRNAAVNSRWRRLRRPYLRGGRFNKDALLTLIQEALKTGATLGFRFAGLIAHAETVLWHPAELVQVVSM